MSAPLFVPSQTQMDPEWSCVTYGSDVAFVACLASFVCAMHHHAAAAASTFVHKKKPAMYGPCTSNGGSLYAC